MLNGSIECIICGSEIQEQSEEHVLPEAIGGKRTIKTVCRRCNSLLGEKVDCLMTEDPAIRFLRARFKIPNKDNNTLNLISDLKKGEYHDENGNKIVIKDGDGKSLPPYYAGNPTPEVQITHTADGQYSIAWSAMDLESAIKKAGREAQKQGFELSTEQLRSMMESSMTVECSNVLFQYDIFANPNNYVPCAIKIAYEIMCDCYPEYWKTDELGKKYREYLYSAISGIPSGDQLDIDSLVKKHTDYSNAQNNHILILRCEGSCLYANIYFFSTLRYSVCMSHSPENYNIDEESSFAYFLN